MFENANGSLFYYIKEVGCFNLRHEASDICSIILVCDVATVWKVSKYRVISGLYFPVFSPNIGKYGPETIPYLDNFHAVAIILSWYHL